jgi:hypothetical protein
VRLLHRVVRVLLVQLGGMMGQNVLRLLLLNKLMVLRRMRMRKYMLGRLSCLMLLLLLNIPIRLKRRLLFRVYTSLATTISMLIRTLAVC